jgi:alkylation response protein AidB-like acyl-CoA dehydrogenase
MNDQTIGAVADMNELECLKQEIRSRREEFEKLRHIPRDMVRKLKKIGVYRAFVPKSLGGDELSAAQFLYLIEELSRADASTGWVASFGVSATYLAALPKDTFEHIYGQDPNLTFAGSIFPPQKVEKTETGFLVSGRWPYASGCMGADLIGGGIIDDSNDSPLPRMAVMPADKIEIDEVWDTVGLCATGSHDVVAKDVPVDANWTFIRGSKAKRDEPIFKYPAMALAAQVLAVVGLGAAREALDFLRETGGRKSITGGPAAGEKPYVQYELAKAEATLAGARAFFYDVTEKAWEQILAGDPVAPDVHVNLRLAATEAARAGADVSRRAFELGGTPAIVRGHTLNRCMMDAAAVGQHAFMGIGTWMSAGAVMLDQPGLPGYP